MDRRGHQLELHRQAVLRTQAVRLTQVTARPLDLPEARRQLAGIVGRAEKSGLRARGQLVM